MFLATVAHVKVQMGLFANALIHVNTFWSNLFYVSEQKVVVFVEETLHIVRDVTRVVT